MVAEVRVINLKAKECRQHGQKREIRVNSSLGQPYLLLKLGPLASIALTEQICSPRK